jgi:excisionase family DNA binding protein
MATVREGSEAVWLRVGDVADALGVSANTVRRWTDVGRIAAHRSPGGHRRYLAADVFALIPVDEREGAAQPGDFAALRRQTQDLQAFFKAGLGLTSLLAEDPRSVPGEVARTLCELTGAPRCDVYLTDGDRLRLSVSVEGGELDAGRQGAAWATNEWVPVDGDPTAAGVICLQTSERGLAGAAR